MASWRRLHPVLILRVLAILAVMIVLLPVVRVAPLVRWLTPPRLPSRRSLDDVRLAVRHVDGVLRRIPAPRYGHCLLRSLTLYYLCTHLGYPVRIAFGMRRDVNGSPIGHGWLVLDGRPFMERGAPDREFVQLWSLPFVEPEADADRRDRRVGSHSSADRGSRRGARLDA